MEENPTYKTYADEEHIQAKLGWEPDEIPQTLGEVLRALCKPFLEEECGWRILSRKGEDGTWLWVRYPIGEFMKRRLAMYCSGGYSTDFFKEEVVNGTLQVDVKLTIFDPQRPTEHCMTVQGLGETELEKDEDGQKTLVTGDVRKAARTYAIKDAAELLGMGVGEGARAYTNSYTNPDGERTDKWGIPLREYQNGHMTGGRKSGNGKPILSALSDAGAVQSWLKVKAEMVDTTHLGEDAYKKNSKALAATLEEMGVDPKAVMAAAWGKGPYKAQQVIATQQLARRTHAKDEIQRLLG
jgi:hypothetical protein